MIQVLELECPGCGRPLSTDMKECPACHRPVIISSVSNVAAMSSLEINKYVNTYNKALAANPADSKTNGALAICLLKLKLYDKAASAFDKALVDDLDNSEMFFWAAVCVLKGRKAFLCQRTEIEKAEEYIHAAIMIEPRGIYYYFWAYIRQDFYARKFLRVQPDFHVLLSEAVGHNVTETEINQLFDTLNVSQPSALTV